MRPVGSPSSKSGPENALGAGRFGGAASPSPQAGCAMDTEHPSTTGQTAVKVPISLTPMQPPPDVLAAMKGRAALADRRPRFSTPPDDVLVALERTREANSRGHDGHTDVLDHEAAHGEDGTGGTRRM